MSKIEKKPVYIKSIEASKIYTHINRNEKLYTEYVGMIPFSLELVQLRKAGLVELVSKKDGLATVTSRNRAKATKFLSDDIINVKFRQSVLDVYELISRMQRNRDERLINIQDSKIKTGKEKEAETNGINTDFNNRVAELREEAKANPSEWKNKVSIDMLRETLYNDGFTIEDYRGEKVKYVAYKRSSAKSRTGECLFIKEELHDVMIEWSRLGLPFEEGANVDLAGLLAYESLVGSSLENLVKIPVENILLISDVDSKFSRVVNVVEKSPLGLVSKEAEATISNSLFDGESLLSSEYFTNGKSMMLLRNHFFKSASFSTHIQTFLMDHKPEDIEFDEWMIEDMLGNEIKASDIHLIITPSSLKALKFSSLLGGEREMYDHWKQVVEADESIFGICKSEKESRRGRNEDGQIMQRLSYQMVNSLPASEDDIKKLSEFEVAYIDKLKNDNEVFVDYLIESTNISNSNAMYAELYKINPAIASTNLFKDFKKKKIYDYVDSVKRGKIRVSGDYAVLLGNPVEFLLHSISQLMTEGVTEESLVSHSIVGNEVHSTLYDAGESLVAFRNPHTSPSNILLAKNKHHESITKYFNLTENIVVVNSIKFEIQDRLSGADFDSDTMLLSNDKILVKLGHEASSYKVCINNVPAKNKVYSLTSEDKFEVDRELANDNIGKVVNLGQSAQSVFWDAIGTERDNYEEIAKDMKEVVEIVSVLSGIAIDTAKRAFEINTVREINILKSRVDKYKLLNSKGVKCNPNFTKHTSKKSNKKGSTTLYETPMDYLVKILSNLKRAKETPTTNIWNLINHYDVNGNAYVVSEANHKQEKAIITLVDEAVSRLMGIRAQSNENDQEFKVMTDEVMEILTKGVSRRNVDEKTMYAIMYHIFYKKTLSEDSYLLNTLYVTQKKNFVNTFVQESPTILKKIG